MALVGVLFQVKLIGMLSRGALRLPSYRGGVSGATHRESRAPLRSASFPPNSFLFRSNSTYTSHPGFLVLPPAAYPGLSVSGVLNYGLWLFSGSLPGIASYWSLPVRFSAVCVPRAPTKIAVGSLYPQQHQHLSYFITELLTSSHVNPRGGRGGGLTRTLATGSRSKRKRQICAAPRSSP